MYIRHIPFPPLGQWATIFSKTLNANVATYTNYSLRCIIPSADITGVGSQVRVTLKAPTATDGFKCDNVSIVKRSSNADGTATPTNLLFSGSAVATVALNAELTSDETSFLIEAGADYIVICDISSDTAYDSFIRLSDAGGTYYYKATTNSYDQQTVTGFTAVTSYYACVAKIEAR